MENKVFDIFAVRKTHVAKEDDGKFYVIDLDNNSVVARDFTTYMAAEQWVADTSAKRGYGMGSGSL